MGWLSRTFRPADEHVEASTDRADSDASASAATPPAPSGAPGTGARTPQAPGAGAPRPAGRYGPLVCITRFDTAAPELEWQLPLNGELYRLMPGSDRPDYSLLVLERPLHFYPADGFDLRRLENEQQVQDRKGRTMARVHALLLCARFVGEQLHPGMKDLAVNFAYVIDNSLARDPEVDFAKIEFAGTGFLSEGYAPRPSEQTQPAAPRADQPAAPPAGSAVEAPTAAAPAPEERAGRHTPSSLLDELATTLRRGVEEQRGAPVRKLTAALTVDAEHRLTGLSGNADGEAPVPTPETFARLGELLADLAAYGASGRVAAVTLRVDGDSVSHEVTRSHP